MAVVALLLGFLFLLGSATPRVQTTTFTLQPGATYCTIHSFDVAAGGSVTDTFSASPGTVYQYVMTAAQEQAFFAGSGLSDLGADQAASDTFTTNLPSGGTYYVVSCHGPGYEQTVQTGSHTMTISGLEPVGLIVGIVAVLVGLILVVVGLRSRSRAARDHATFTGPTPPPNWPATGPTAAIPYPAAAYGAPALRTLHVAFENASAADETLQVLLNGAPLATVSVPAGKSTELDLHPNLSVPPGGTMTVEAVSGSGQRAAQPVVPDAQGRATVALRLG